MLFTVISLYFFFILFAVVYCTAHITSYNHSIYAKNILLLCIAICLYIFGYMLELHADAKAEVIFWNKIAYIGIPYISALWLWLSMAFTGCTLHNKAPLIVGIFVIPTISMVLRLTNELHHLYLASETFVFQRGHLLLVRTAGPWMHVQFVYTTVMIILSSVLFYRDFTRNKEWNTPKTFLVSAASLLSVLGVILLLIKPFELSLDYLALCLPLACLLVILAVIRYHFLVVNSMVSSRVFYESTNPILLVNKYNKVIDYNKSAINLLNKINVHLSIGYIGTLFSQVPELLKSLESHNTTVARVKIDGEKRYFETTTKGIDDSSSPPCYIKTIRDVSDIYRLNETLAHQAMIDDLSGLHNRRAFMQLGRTFFAQADMLGKSIYYYMMDLDHFKVVNDKYGHICGDELIRAFSAILDMTFKDASCLTARLGGEEFGVLIIGLSDEEALQKAEQLRQNAADYTCICDGVQLRVTVSIGITKKRYAAQTLDDLLRIADKALYESKDAGRNCVTFI